MSRLSIELTPEQHQKIKAIAAMKGNSIREYVLERILPSAEGDTQVLRELEAFLAPRIKEAENGDAVKSTALEIFEAAFSK